MSADIRALPFSRDVTAIPPAARSVGPWQSPTALDFLAERWRFCAGFSFAVMLALAVRLVDALPGSAWSTFTRSVIQIWLVQWLPAALAIGVGIGLLNQRARLPWQRGLGALLLVVFFSTAFLWCEQRALAIVAQRVGFMTIADEIAADRASFYLGQMTAGALYFSLLAWFYLQVQAVKRGSAALGATQLAGLRVSQAMAQDRLSSLQAHVDPDFLFAALSHVQRQYQRDAVQAQAALDEVITFLRSALPRRHAEDRAFAEEIALAESYLRLAGLIDGRPFALRASVANAASEAAAFPPQICLPLVRALAAIIAPDQTMQISGRVLDNRFQVTLVVPLADEDAVGPTALTTAIGTAAQSLTAIYGARATLQYAAAHQHFHINIEIPYATIANR